MKKIDVRYIPALKELLDMYIQAPAEMNCLEAKVIYNTRKYPDDWCKTRCPLCKVEGEVKPFASKSCATCPWVVMTGEACNHSSNRYQRIETAVRIKQILQWLSELTTY